LFALLLGLAFFSPLEPNTSSVLWDEIKLGNESQLNRTNYFQTYKLLGIRAGSLDTKDIGVITLFL